MLRTLLRATPLAAVCILLLVPALAQAAPGQLRLSWGSCSSVVNNISVAPGQTGIQFVASVSGQSDPTLSYEVHLLYGDIHRNVPDAWRFDPVGCQGSPLVTVQHISPTSLAKTCPQFQDAGGSRQSVQIKDVNFSPPTLPYPTSLMRVVLANVYPGGNVPDPNETYFLMGVVFDETFGVNGPSGPPGTTCGGLERIMCFTLLKADYILNDGLFTEVPFVYPNFGYIPLTVNDTSGTGCLVDAAKPATWGQIKAQYRN